MPDLSSPIIWLIPTLVLAIFGALVLLSRYFRGKTEQSLKELRITLRQLQRERRGLVNKAQSYSGRDPEPYRSASTSLREKLAEIRRDLEGIEQRHIELHERAAGYKTKRWRMMLSAPYRWRTLHLEADRLHKEMGALQSEVQKASRMEAFLNRLPWQVALAARGLRARMQELDQVLDELRSQGLYGDTFEAAVRSERQLSTALAQIPTLFLEAEETSVLQQTGKAEVSLTHQILEANRPRLDELLLEANQWKQTSVLTSEQVSRMRSAFDELEQSLAGMPAELDIHEERSKLRQMGVIATNLEAAVSRMEVESIASVGGEAERLRQAAEEQNQHLQQTREKLESLETMLGDLANGFRELSLQMAALGSRSVHPVQWDTSLEQLAQLNRQTNALGNIRQQRTLKQVDSDYQAAAALSAQQKELDRYVQEIQSLHAELVIQHESPDFQGMPDWIKRARSTAEQAETFSPENWSRSDNVSGLTAEIDSLAAEMDELLGSDLGEPVSELKLAERLDRTLRLGESYRLLNARVEGISQKVENLKNQEKAAQGKLEDLGKMLNQIRLIVQSNQFLSGIALREIDRLQSEIDGTEESLSQRQRGSLEKKSRQIDTLSTRILDTANGWFDQLGREIQVFHREMAGFLAQLDAIARLEDGSVIKTRSLISQDQEMSGIWAVKKKRTNLEEILLELKRRSDHWQECIAAQKEIENVEPLLETYQEAEFQRKQALELITAAGSRQSKRTWPPSSTSLEAERLELDRIEEEWQSLKDRSGKAISLVAQYSQLSSRYHSLGERLRQAANRREQEQRQVEDLEEQIVALIEPWESMLAQYRDNPTASREIRELLSSMDEEMENLERGYLRNELDYDQVIQQMRNLQRRVRYYQVALDDEHALDASGRITRRRQSERDVF